MIDRVDERDRRLGQPRSIALNGRLLSSFETSSDVDGIAATATRHGIETGEERRENSVREGQAEC